MHQLRIRFSLRVALAAMFTAAVFFAGYCVGAQRDLESQLQTTRLASKMRSKRINSLNEIVQKQWKELNAYRKRVGERPIQYNPR